MTGRLEDDVKLVKKASRKRMKPPRAVDSSPPAISTLKNQIARLKRQLVEMRGQQAATSEVLTVTSKVNVTNAMALGVQIVCGITWSRKS